MSVEDQVEAQLEAAFGSAGAPVAVAIVEDLRAVPRKVKDVTVTYHTYTATAGGAENILGRAPNRKAAVISVLGVVGTNSNIVLGKDQAMVQYANAEGSGAVLQPGMSVTLEGTNVLWLGALAGTPTTVSVIEFFEAYE